MKPRRSRSRRRSSEWYDIPEPPKVSTNKLREEVIEQREAEPAGWNYGVPDLALIKIFDYLSYKDRFNASLVCSAWSKTFWAPELWRNLTIDTAAPPRETNRLSFLLDVWLRPSPLSDPNSTASSTDLNPATNNAIKKGISVQFAKNFGMYQHVQKLQLSFERKLEGNQIQYLCDLLETLKMKATNLRTIIISKFYRRTHLNARLIWLLETFLESQMRLKEFRIVECHLWHTYSPLLYTLAVNNAATMKHFQVYENVFFDDKRLLDSVLYREALKSFTALVSLFLDYHYVDGDILTCLADKNRRTLRIFGFQCMGLSFSSQERLIDEITWIEIKKMCPQLKISFKLFIFPSNPSTFDYIVPPTIPLNTLRVRLGAESPYSFAGPGPDSLLEHVKKNCNLDYLVHLHLDFGINRKYTESIVIELISSCHRLRDLYVSGKNAEILVAIFKSIQGDAGQALTMLEECNLELISRLVMMESNKEISFKSKKGIQFNFKYKHVYRYDQKREEHYVEWI